MVSFLYIINTLDTVCSVYMHMYIFLCVFINPWKPIPTLRFVLGCYMVPSGL